MDDRHADALAEHVRNSLERAGTTPRELRAKAAANRDLPPELADLVDKIHRHAYKITDEDVRALRARFGDDELFEIIVAAALGAANQRLQAGLVALAEADR